MRSAELGLLTHTERIWGSGEPETGREQVVCPEGHMITP